MKLSISILSAILALVAGCTWETDLPEEARDVKVDADHELVVTDDALLAGLSHNGADGPLSFARASAALGLRDGALLGWLDAWSARLVEEGRAGRAADFDAAVTCRWLRASPENRCDETCDACSNRALRLEAAPFRLVAIANRTDLSALPDRAADGGEGRLVFGLTDGPADDPSSTPMPLSVIFEYAQRGSALEWTRRWHALGATPARDFGRALVALTDRFVGPGAIGQIRTADALSEPLVLHQFALASGEIVPTDVRNTPDFARVAPAAMRAFILDNGDAIDRGTVLLPREWWARSSSTADTVPEYVEELPRHDAFVRQTCGGCHAQSDGGFHVDPRATGRAKLSRFLSDPTKELDELRRRAEWMQLTLISDR